MDSIYIDKNSEVREIYKAAEKSTIEKAKERFLSLDFFRGLVMGGIFHNKKFLFVAGY